MSRRLAGSAHVDRSGAHYGVSLIGGVLVSLADLERLERHHAERLVAPAVPALFVVWIDISFGGDGMPVEWEQNDEPMPLGDALRQLDELRHDATLGGPWICKLVPEGMKP